MKKAIKRLVVIQAFIFLSYLYSNIFYANLQVAFLSSFFIILGSSFAYNKMIKSRVLSKNYVDQRDDLDIIDDPFDLYSEEEVKIDENLDLRQIVKEEKEKIKTFSFNSIKEGTIGSLSVYRIVPYIFLILGFIALKNNELLHLGIYLPSLLVGIIAGYLTGKDLFS